MKEFFSLAKKNLLYLSALSFLFICSFSFVINKSLSTSSTTTPKYHKVIVATPLPVLGTTSSFPILSAQGVIATDLDSAVSLYEKNPDLPLLPASTTKIMTAMVALEYYNLDEVLVVNRTAFVEGQKMGLFLGEKISVEKLLYGLLMSSANDAAEVLAANYQGGREAFIQRMNDKAKELNLINTVFKNPSGLDGEGHYSTARDLVRLSKIALENEIFSQMVSTQKLNIKNSTGTIEHRLVNINELLGQVEGVKGVKTGWTENARENLVTYIERDGKRILIALLGSQDRFGETKELIEWIFKNYKWEEVIYSSDW